MSSNSKKSNLNRENNLYKIKQYLKSDQFFIILLIFGQLWVSVISWIGTQLIYIDYGVSCSGIMPLVKVIPLVFFISQMFNAIYSLYLYSKKIFKNWIIFTIPMANLFISGIIFAILYVVPMC